MFFFCTTVPAETGITADYNIPIPSCLPIPTTPHDSDVAPKLTSATSLLGTCFHIGKYIGKYGLPDMLLCGTEICWMFTVHYSTLSVFKVWTAIL